MTISQTNVNLAELRGEITARVSTALMLMGGVLIAATWPLAAMWSTATVPLALLLLAGGWLVRRLAHRHPTLARYLLCGGLLGGLLAAMWWLPATWIPFLAVVPVFVGALLMAGADAATAVAVGALALALNLAGYRDYPLPALALTLLFSVLLSWQTVRTLYTAVDWADNSQRQARHFLEVARNRQAELMTLSRSLEQSVAVLKRTQVELVAARQQADEARRAKDQFVAKITHELRTPLNVILGFSEIMQTTPEVYELDSWPPRLRRDVAQIYRNSRYLLEMVDDILSLSNFEAVEFGLNREPTELAPLLQDTLDFARTLFAGKPVHVEGDFAEDLPVLALDRTRMRQVLINLLTNAQRFTDSGRVRLAAHTVGSAILISVEDTGSGIPADQIDHIFEAFYQGDRTLYGRRGGAGLGLAICKQFVEAHGGRIAVTSVEGQGATFILTLPILPLAPPPGASAVTGAPVLVVDPDPAVVDLLQRRLPEWRLVHLPGADLLGAEAASCRPHAVIVNRPLGTYDAVDAGADLPVIECSMPSKSWITHDLAVDGLLAKPVSRTDLVAQIDRLLAQTPIRDVLVVDDNRSFCLLLERMLAAAGRDYQVRAAYDVESARAALVEATPDLLLLDLDVGGDDGRRLVETMRGIAVWSAVPIVVLTGAEHAVMPARQTGSDLVVRRGTGLRPSEVVACISGVLAGLDPRYPAGGSG